MNRRALVVAFGLVIAGCGTGSTDVAFDEPVPSLFDDSEMTGTGEIVTTTARLLGVDGVDPDVIPAPRLDAAGVVVFESLVAPVVGTEAGTWTVATPCGASRSGEEPSSTTAVVVLDPIGDAATEAGSASLARNARLAELVRDRLVSADIGAISTRDATADVPAPYRREVAEAAGARVVVSIALVEGEAESQPEPSLEIVHPAADTESRRLAGLLHAAVDPVVERFAVDWPADVEPGVRAVLNQRGSDYFAVLQESSGASRAVLHLPVAPEAAETVWASDSNLVPVSDAVADAIVRFLVTEDEGTGFVTPLEVVREAVVADPTATCVDPLALEVED